MTGEDSRRFAFVSHALPDETFEVVRFRGIEGISRLYEFDITLVSEDPEIDLRAVLQNPASLTVMRSDGDDRIVHGILSQFEQLQEEDEYIFYRAVLVPRLWQADLYRENQLFLNKNIPDIIEEILRQAALTTDDYELRLTRTYAEREHICQYSETDFNFISRWMEHEGIYYYFEQTEEFEKLIITDNSSGHEDITDPSTIEYYPPSSITAREQEIVRQLICRQQMLPRRVVLRDYNYRRPDLELRAEASVDTQGRGDVYLYGQHFGTPEEGNELARIRAEEILCRESVFHGEATVPTLCSGYVFQLSGHYRESYNQRFLITEVEHIGSQAGSIFGGDERLSEGETGVAYSDRFVSIPADLQFRPERTTQGPRFYGTMNARVDASGDGQYAEIDDQGRYKVRLFFDQSDREGGGASQWVRMAQPYAGADYGMHFPLHRGTEVLMTFIDGDPDRPIISGAVPNPETSSPINSDNQTQCMIRTGGGNQIHAEDSDGGQLINIQTPTDSTSIRIGASDSNGPSGVMIFTAGSEHIVVQGDRELTVDRTDTVRVTGERTKEVGENENITITGGLNVEVGRGVMTTVTAGGETHDVTGDRHVLLTGEEIHTVSNGRHVTVSAGGETYNVSGGREVTVVGGETRNISDGETRTITSGRTLNITGNDNYTVNGPRSITVNGPEQRNIALLDNIVQGFEKSVKLAAAIELFMGFKNETKLSLGLEQKAISISHAAVNLGKDMIKSDNGKIVMGEKILLDNRLARIFA
jgi:type VI secretion system secreted protein VgrG